MDGSGHLKDKTPKVGVLSFFSNPMVQLSQIVV